MALNITEDSIPEPTGSVSTSSANVVTPTLTGVSATTMPPTIAAGVNLAKTVLYITTGAIVLFFAYLLMMEYEVASNVQDAYKSVNIQNRTGAEFEAVSRFEKAIADLAALQKDPGFQLGTDNARNVEDVLALVSTMPSIASAQKAQLKDCWPIPSDVATRGTKLAPCSRILSDVRAAALDAMANASIFHAAGERATKVNEHRQTLHTFWIQAVQVILVNVLLPLLTALFGYIFGTQQAQRNG